MANDLFYEANRILQPDFEVFCSATLKKDYRFVNGDEGFYRFIGKNSGLSLTELLWEEDIANFVEALDKLPQGPQVFMGKIRAGDDSYYSLFFMLSYNGKVSGDFKLIDIGILDFPSMKQRYTNYVSNVKKFGSFLSLLPNLFFEYNMESDVLVVFRYVNQKPTIVFNDELKEFVSKINPNVFYDQEDKIALFNFYENLKDDSERFEALIPAKLIRNELVEGYYKFKCSAFYEDGKKVKKIGIIEKLEQSQDSIKYYLTENAYDISTGLFNKRAINDYAIEKIQESLEHNQSMYIVVMDIDDFKMFNDTYGHMFGDKVLSKISDIIRNVVGMKGSCGRFGGDEFMIVLDGVHDENNLRTVLKTIRKNISYAFFDGDNKIEVTTSLGISKFPDDGTDFEQLFEIADKCLYIAKEKGKDRFIIYDEKKHGGIAITDAEKRSSGFHNLVSTSEKGSIVSKIILDLNQNGVKNISNIMDTVREYFDIDGIAIYKGNELQRIYESGKYVEPIEKLSFALNSEYQELFNAEGIFSEMVILKIKNIIGEDYKYIEKQETGRFIQCKAGEGDSLTIISYDFFNRAPKVGESDFAFITLIGLLLVNIINKQ